MPRRAGDVEGLPPRDPERRRLPDWLRVTLVYFGFLEDSVIEQRLNDAPMTPWRHAWVAFSTLAFLAGYFALMHYVLGASWLGALALLVVGPLVTALAGRLRSR
jgi:hypothetical protein